MKTLIAPLLVAFSLTLTTFSATQGQANTIDQPTTAATYQSDLYTTAEGKLEVALSKPTDTKVLVRLTDAAGHLLFVQQIGKQKKEFRLRLDVSNLPDGVYQLAMSNGVKTTLHTLTLATQQSRVQNRLVALK